MLRPDYNHFKTAAALPYWAPIRVFFKYSKKGYNKVNYTKV